MRARGDTAPTWTAPRRPTLQTPRQRSQAVASVCLVPAARARTDGACVCDTGLRRATHTERVIDDGAPRSLLADYSRECPRVCTCVARMAWRQHARGLCTNKPQVQGLAADTRTPGHACAPSQGRAASTGSPPRRRRARRSRRAQKLSASRRRLNCRPQQHVGRRPGCHGELAVAGGSLLKRDKSLCDRPSRRQQRKNLLATAGNGRRTAWALGSTRAADHSVCTWPRPRPS